MIAADLQWAAEWTGGRLVDGGAATHFRGVSTDTRTLAKGNLFVGLSGPRFDGGAFLDAAAAGGASAAVTTEATAAGLPCLQVDDTRAALGALGHAWRRRFRGRVIALTGSNGKTTVKECIAAILRRDGEGEALATRGNLNNDIGVPLMLCELDPTHTAAVFELGANHPGEIATLARLVEPDVGLVTNAAAAHLEGFGSIEGVAHAKGELFATMGADATAVIAADEPWAPLWRELAGKRRVVTFGRAAEADVRIVSEAPLELAIGERHERIEWPLVGRHNRMNAAAAAAAAHAAGIDSATIAAGLASVTPVAGRLCRRPGPHDSLLFDDSYNANPGSFAVALDALAETDARRWAVVGEMAELGDAGEAAHRALGERVRAAGVERLWVVGPSAATTARAFGTGAEIVDDLDALAEQLRARLSDAVVLLIKGSRSNGLDRLSDALAGRAKEGRDAV